MSRNLLKHACDLESKTSSSVLRSLASTSLPKFGYSLSILSKYVSRSSIYMLNSLQEMVHPSLTPIHDIIYFIMHVIINLYIWTICDVYGLCNLLSMKCWRHSLITQNRFRNSFEINKAGIDILTSNLC